MKVKLERVATLWKNRKNIPIVVEGDAHSKPVVGERFWVGKYFRTGKVQKIIDDNTFETFNSRYKWIKIN